MTVLGIGVSVGTGFALVRVLGLSAVADAVKGQVENAVTADGLA